MERRPTIIDVARQAGVSTATVSRVLNGGPVNEGTRRAVRRAIDALGYRPNSLARGLVTGRTGVIGVLLPDVLGFINAEIARGIEEGLAPHGMQPLLLTDNRQPAQERDAIGLLRDKQVDGLVLVGSALSDAELREVCGDCRVVLIQRESEGEAFCHVALDDAAGVREAVDHLLQRGHRRLAHIAGLRRDGRARRSAFVAAVQAAGLDEPLLLEGDFTEAGGYRAGLELARAKEVTAVLCANDRTAVGAAAALAAAGRRVPEELSLVGFDDHPWSAYLRPPLTTLRQPARELGRRAAELMARASPPGAEDGLLVRPALVARDSVGSVPRREEEVMAREHRLPSR